MVEDPFETAFDAHSNEYRSRWDLDPSARQQRARVVSAVLATTSPGHRILDLGCGTGTDAAALARADRRVCGVDLSTGMLAQAERHTEGLPVELAQADLREPSTLPEGPFDAALSNFGVLNCIEISPLGAALADRLRPGAPFAAIWMSRWCLPEVASLIVRGHIRTAITRRSGTAQVADQQLPMGFPSHRAVARALQPHFELQTTQALGWAMPAPGSKTRRSLEFLGRIDRRLAYWPVIRSLGDHTLALFRRR